MAAALLASLCTLALAAMPPVTIASSADRQLENEIKAAFLYQFGSYIEWPDGTFADDREPLVIGILAGEEIAGPLSEIVRHRTVKGRPVVTRRIEAGEEIDGIHILFIGASLRPSLVGATLERVRGRPVLTVVDAGHGEGIIRFVIEQDRVRFDVSLDAANDSGIRISSRLLGVARQVQEGPS